MCGVFEMSLWIVNIRNLDYEFCNVSLIDAMKVIVISYHFAWETIFSLIVILARELELLKSFLERAWA